jgi:hypothetical protein
MGRADDPDGLLFAHRNTGETIEQKDLLSRKSGHVIVSACAFFDKVKTEDIVWIISQIAFWGFFEILKRNFASCNHEAARYVVKLDKESSR